MTPEAAEETSDAPEESAEGVSPENVPTEKDWLSMIMLNGNSLILKIYPTSDEFPEDEKFFKDIQEILIRFVNLLLKQHFIFSICPLQVHLFQNLIKFFFFYNSQQTFCSTQNS